MSKKRALSLTETVVAVFIISYCILSVFQLLHTAIDVDGRAERMRGAVLVAQKKLGQVREFAADPANFYSSWAAVVGTATDSEFGDFFVTCNVTNTTIFSPCTQLETLYSSPTDERRKLTQSFKKVFVDVRWDANVPGLELATLVGAPPQIVQSVELSPTSSIPVPLPRDTTVDFTVEAKDSAGNVINDVFFKWYQAPTSNNGSVGRFPTVARDGRSAQFQHFYGNQTIQGVTTPVYGPAGNTTITVRARSMADSLGNQTVEMAP